MKSICIFSILTLVSTTCCASMNNVKSRLVLKDVTIIERSVIPPFTGYVRSWIEFKVKSAGKEVFVFLPNFEDGKRIPEVGQICTITYNIESIDGQAGSQNVNIQNAMVANAMKCESIKK